MITYFFHLLLSIPSIKLKTGFCFLLFGFCFLSSMAYGQANSSAHGVYILNKMEGSFKPAGLKASHIRGISPRIKWRTAEPTEGHYNWSYLDEVFQTAARYNKKVILRVHPGVFTPEWVYHAGAQRIQRPSGWRPPLRKRQLAFDSDREETGEKSNNSETANNKQPFMPVPWDPIYLARWTDFVDKLGKRYNSNPALYAIAVAGPTVTSVEFHLRGKEKDWERFGYTPAKLLSAWKDCIDAFAKAFPDKAIVLNVTFQILGNQQLPRQIVEYGLNTYKNRLFIQGNWLSANTSAKRLDIMKQFTNQTTVGFQMLGTSARIGSLRGAIDNGLAGGASYLEIYEFDVINPELSEDIQYAATQLQIPPDQRIANRGLQIMDYETKNPKSEIQNPKSIRQLNRQLRQAKKSFLHQDYQQAIEKLQEARNTLNSLQEGYPQGKNQFLDAQAKLDQTIDYLNRKDFSSARQSYEEVLQILRAARIGASSP